MRVSGGEHQGLPRSHLQEFIPCDKGRVAVAACAASRSDPHGRRPSRWKIVHSGANGVPRTPKINVLVLSPDTEYLYFKTPNNQGGLYLNGGPLLSKEIQRLFPSPSLKRGENGRAMEPTTAHDISRSCTVSSWRTVIFRTVGDSTSGSLHAKLSVTQRLSVSTLLYRLWYVPCINREYYLSIRAVRAVLVRSEYLDGYLERGQ